MFLPSIFDDLASGVSRVPSHSGQVWNVITRSTKRRTCGCSASTSLESIDFWTFGMTPFVREVDALDLDLGRLLVEEVVHLLLRVLADRLVQVEADALEEAAVPPVHAVAGDHQAALVQGLRLVVERREVEVGDRAHALAARTHAAQVDHVADHVLLDPAAGLLRAHHPARLPRRDVERERRGGTDVRRAQPAEEDPEHRVGVGRGADGGAGVGAHPLLVDDDRRRQPLEQVDLGPRQRRHEALHEGAVGLVDQPLRLRGDRAEDQRALARAGDAGEHRQPALRDLDADVLEVVHARALHADQVVAVGVVQRPGRAHRVSICRAGPSGRQWRSG